MKRGQALAWVLINSAADWSSRSAIPPMFVALAMRIGTLEILTLRDRDATANQPTQVAAYLNSGTGLAGGGIRKAVSRITVPSYMYFVPVVFFRCVGTGHCSVFV